MERASLLTVLVTAVIAAAGYVAKLAIDTSHEWRVKRQIERASLYRLRSLLIASRVAFRVQRQQADRLAANLRQTKPQFPTDNQGLEHLLSQAHAQLSPDEVDHHAVIRGYTEHALFPINGAMLEWLRSDVEHRIELGKAGNELALAVLLNSLDSHLQLWLAKYHAWIPTHPEHALVYLADEELHGVGFPTGIDSALDAVVGAQGKPTP
jgi:hypothetical protein